ncbi:hypothetical protein D9619_013547 [Psilocybe cf. subviscida]|uniref:Protein kinase domain-containing protein n=1 Tax=Psilocybe cf. subviscida TaxID=2480587 RepID=A0A8H5AQC5_9AGAR|nr:hypothetical protein D9619_013547 [Psilocybe cf. subviscida]
MEVLIMTSRSWVSSDLHTLDMVHTDLKPDNIVFVDDTLTTFSGQDSHGRPTDKANRNVLQDVRIKIVDLEDTRTLIAKSTAFVGTIGYTPPEVYCGIGWGFSLDVYSFGCVMYEIQYGRRFMPDFPQVNASFAFLERAIGPFKPMLVKEIREHCDFLFTDDTKRPRVQVSRQYARLVNAEVGSFRDILRNHISNGSHAFKCLMVRCLNADSRVRPTAEDCVKHLQIQADGSLPPVDETMAE